MDLKFRRFSLYFCVAAAAVCGSVSRVAAQSGDKLPFTYRRVTRGVQVLSYSGTDGKLRAGDVITYLATPRSQSFLRVSTLPNLEASARTRKNKDGVVAVTRERQGSQTKWVMIRLVAAPASKLPFTWKRVARGIQITSYRGTDGKLQPGDVLTYLATPKSNAYLSILSQQNLESVAIARQDKNGRLAVVRERSGTKTEWVTINLGGRASSSKLPFTWKRVPRGVEVLSYTGRDGHLAPGDVLTFFATPQGKSPKRVLSQPNLESAALASAGTTGRLAVVRERNGSAEWTVIRVAAPGNIPDNGKIPDNGNPGTAKPGKVVALFAVDSDDAVTANSQIRASGRRAQRLMESYCQGQYVFKAADFLEIDRLNAQKKPAAVLRRINEMQTDASSIIFVYLCCHGGYKNNDHFLFLAEDDNDANVLTGVKRSDLVAALKRKPHHTVLFITDSCSSLIKTNVRYGRSVVPKWMTNKDKFYRILASLPQGTFLDINTSRKGQFSAISGEGIATKALFTAVEKLPASSNWNSLRVEWQKQLTTAYQNLRSTVGTNPANSAAIKAQYQKQTNQTLDIKTH